MSGRGLSRRGFLGVLGALAVSPACAPGPARREGFPSVESSRIGMEPTPIPGVLLNDVHSKLNETRVARVVEIDSLDRLHFEILRARAEGMAISVGGGLHSMGGQAFGEGTLHFDTRRMNRVLGFDHQDGYLKVEAGIQWPALIDWYRQKQAGDVPAWGIAQKQTGADRLTIGGALSANAHGRGLTMRPIVDDVESFTLIDAGGGFRNCSRSENRELFDLVIGGYGLFGVIYSVRLRLRPLRKLERVVEVRSSEGLIEAFDRRIADGFLYGDFQLETNEFSPTFLRRGVFACYRPVAQDRAMPEGERELSPDEWMRLLHLGHADKAKAFEVYSGYYLSTNGQLYWTDTNQLSYYPENYHLALDRESAAAVPGSEMITEIYVPRARLEDFLEEAARRLREAQANVIYGTIRLIEKDRESFLAWAKEGYACTVLNLHVDHSPAGIDRAKDSFRMLIDLARTRGGSFFLTYHRWATREQVLDCYPQFPEFLRHKLRYDPEDRFQSEWVRQYRALLG